MTAESTRHRASVPIAGATGAFPAHVTLSLLATVALLCGCDPTLTPDQISAIERVEAAKAAYSREFQPQMDSFQRCLDESLDSLKRCMDERLVERCADRCKRIFKPGSEKQLDLERCADRCMDDERERRLDHERCTKEGEDQSSCGKKFAAAPKPSSAEYDLAVRNCVERCVPNDYCIGKRRHK